MEFIQIDVREREKFGSQNAVRLRRDGFVPAVLYGLGRRNVHLTIPGTEIDRFLRTGSHLIELRLGDRRRPAILREVQLDPVTDDILHIDFHRVDKDTDIEDDVTLTFKGEAPGVKAGGIFQTVEETLRIRCRPNLIPRELVIDVSKMEINDTVLSQDVELPEGVALVTPEDTALATLTLPVPEPEPAEAEEAEAEAEAAEAEGEARAEGEDAEAPPEGTPEDQS